MKSFFEPNADSPTRLEDQRFNLAVVRILYFTLVFLLIGRLPYFRLWHEVPAEFWLPTGIMLPFRAPPVTSELHDLVFMFWRLSLPLCALGLFYRVLGPLNFIAGFFLMNFAHSFGYQGHMFMPVLLAGFPLAFAQAADALSLDQIRSKSILGTDDPRIYSWPIRTMQLVFCLVFFAAGFSKLRYAGLDWIVTDHLRNYLLRSSIVFNDVSQTANMLALGRWLYELPLLCHVLAGFAIAIEVSTLFAFFSRRFACVIIPIVLLMQIGIYFTLFVNFRLYLAIYVAWVDWVWIWRTIRGSRFFAPRRREVA